MSPRRVGYKRAAIGRKSNMILCDIRECPAELKMDRYQPDDIREFAAKCGWGFDGKRDLCPKHWKPE